MNDEPFRPYSDPENEEFMKEVMDRHVPQELVERGFKDISVGIVDMTSEDYGEKVEEKKFNAFEGQGVSLGQAKGVALDVNENVETGYDPNKPHTKINIRIHNGEVLSKEFNLDQKLSDVFDFVTLSAPVDGDFQLVEGFPPQALTEVGKTIQQLGLQNSMIIQKLI